MDQFCSPYGQDNYLESTCLMNFIPTTFDSFIFISLLFYEQRNPTISYSDNLDVKTIGLTLSIFLLYFLQLTLVLFYINVSIVSAAQVTALASSSVLWLFVLAYNFSFSRRTGGRSMIFGRIFIISRLFIGVYGIFLYFMIYENVIQSNLLDYIQYSKDLLIFIFAITTNFIKNKDIDDQLLLKYKKEDKSSASYQTKNFYQKLSMFWVLPILKLGTIRPISTEDIEDLGEQDKSWTQNQRLQIFIKPLYKSISKYSLLISMFKCYKKEILLITFLGVIVMILEFTTPIYIKLLENFLNSSQPTWRGVALVIYMLLTKLAQTALRSYHTFIFNLLSYNMQTALSSEIYQKLLKISSSSLSTLSYGKILNLINIDSGQITTGLTDTMKLSVLPFTFIIGFYLMFSTIGYLAGFTASCIVLVLLFLNTLIGRFSSLSRSNLMTSKDRRIRTCNELLSNIRVLKIFNWEYKISDQVLLERDVELKHQLMVLVWFLISIFLNWGTQDYMAAGVISTMALSGTILTPGNVYSGLAIMKVLNTSIFVLPPIINCLVQTRVSVERIQEYLRTQDQVKYVSCLWHEESAILMKNASFSWKTGKNEENGKNELLDMKKCLKDLNFSVKRGELVAVVGKVAAGKSSLIQALIENMQLVGADEATVQVNGRIAYCCQEAWIQNKTIRENIVFGEVLDEKRYFEVLNVCSLKEDLDNLVDGDNTEIGERGINLSGGQKARVNLARAVYANANILMLDDPLAALDQYVSQKVFEECIKKYLHDKTRLFATNNQQYLSLCDRIIVLRKGQIVQINDFQTLSNQPGYFKDKLMIKINQRSMSSSVPQELEQSNPNPTTCKKLCESEDRATGKVDKSIYKAYFSYFGYFSLFSVFFLMIIWQGVRMSTDLFLANWTTQSKSSQETNLMSNVLIYLSGCILVNLIILITNLTSFKSGLQASKLLFIELLNSLSRASIPDFYDINPMGRVINRLSKDINELDHNLVYVVFWAITQVFAVFMNISFCVFTVPAILLSLPFTIFLGFKVQKFYLSTSREVIRLASISKSPISQHFSESLSGLSTIRAFAHQNRFKTEFCRLVDRSTILSIYETGCSGWINITLEVIFDLVLCVSALFIVYARDDIDRGLAAACLIYAMSLPTSVSYMIISLSALENAMVSAERVRNMTSIPCEALRNREDDEKLINWPKNGCVLFDKVEVRYRKDTQLVLKGISFEVAPGEKVGIMGRTGSGKSTVVKALLRIVEKSAGRILIDGVDVGEVGLDYLRQRICVIVQEPALFQGRLRDNLDLFGKFTDKQINDVTEVLGFRNHGLNLEYEIQENANNLSVGQKQLVCIARALLKKSQVVILDEATASIDFQTDILIQKIMQDKLKDCTVIMIAHRIATVENCNRVMVLDNGEISEFDTISNLKQKSGLYSRLIKEELSALT